MTELNEIKIMGAVPQKNSGRGKIEKGDAVLGPFLVDVKEYDESFSVSRTNWAKLQSDAFTTERRQPMFWLSLGSKKTPHRLRCVVLGREMFEEMYEAWKEKYDSE